MENIYMVNRRYQSSHAKVHKHRVKSGVPTVFYDKDFPAIASITNINVTYSICYICKII